MVRHNRHHKVSQRLVSGPVSQSVLFFIQHTTVTILLWIRVRGHFVISNTKYHESHYVTVRYWIDLPQVDCERASENEGRSRETRAKVARRVDLFRLRNIEFNLHIVGAKKLQEQSTGCTGLSYSKIRHSIYRSLIG